MHTLVGCMNHIFFDIDPVIWGHVREDVLSLGLAAGGWLPSRVPGPRRRSFQAGGLACSDTTPFDAGPTPATLRAT